MTVQIYNVEREPYIHQGGRNVVVYNSGNFDRKPVWMAELQGFEIATADELREIADMLDEMNGVTK